LAAKKHARLNLEGKNYVLTDLGTWKGTKVNGLPIQERILLNKDEIQIGSTKIRFLTNVSDSEYTSQPKSQSVAIATKNKPGKEKSSDSAVVISRPVKVPVSGEYVASSASSVFHFPTCNWAKGIRTDRLVYFKTVGDAIVSRRRSCVTCKPGMENKDVEFWLKISNDGDEKIRNHARKMIKKLTGKEHV
jgi:pSer/pThr/pTyr-binding forkhead associated (FHA) protein